MPITHVSQIQHIIDYLEKELLGRNTLGYSVPVYFVDKSGLRNAASSAALKSNIEDGKQTAFTKYVFPANTRSGRKAVAVYILAGQPFEVAIGDVSNELVKPYIIDLNSSDVIAEGGGVIADGGVYRLLMEASGGSVDIYGLLKSMLSPTRARALARFDLTDLSVSGNVFAQGYRVAWLAATSTIINGSSIIELMASRPDGRPTLEETKAMLEYLIGQSEDEMLRRVNARELWQYSSQVEALAVKRLGRNEFTFAIERVDPVIVANYGSRFTAP